MPDTSTARLDPKEVIAACLRAVALGYGIDGASIYRPKAMSGQDRDTVCPLGALWLARMERDTFPNDGRSGGMFHLVEPDLGLTGDYASGFGRASNGMPPNYCTYDADPTSHGMAPEYALGYFDGLRAYLGAKYDGVPISSCGNPDKIRLADDLQGGCW